MQYSIQHWRKNDKDLNVQVYTYVSKNQVIQLSISLTFIP